jgi:hypothetical protein
MSKKNLLSFYYNLNTGLYGLTEWTVDGSLFELEAIQTGILKPVKILEFFTQFDNKKYSLLAEGTPEMNPIVSILKSALPKVPLVQTVEREGLLPQQMATYRTKDTKDRFRVSERFLVPSDLIFDEWDSTNLIDPILSDEQKYFPLTESLLIAFHLWRRKANTGMDMFMRSEAIQNTQDRPVSARELITQLDL